MRTLCNGTHKENNIWVADAFHYCNLS
uniref:Uncharacterized protein n=1 Tax=Rhizophora mucronata TaxID=61149 RepID=A0A2P2NRS3_RHIMU